MTTLGFTVAPVTVQSIRLLPKTRQIPFLMRIILNSILRERCCLCSAGKYTCFQSRFDGLQVIDGAIEVLVLSFCLDGAAAAAAAQKVADPKSPTVLDDFGFHIQLQLDSILIFECNHLYDLFRNQ